MTAAIRKDAGGGGILLQAGSCSVIVVPHLGGKIASICVNGNELLQAPLAVYAPRTLTMPFDASDASGWDECLPSVAGCTVKTANGLAAIPDHGDLWRVEWTEQKAMNAQEGTITLRGECFSLPLVLDRTLTLAEMENGWQLGLSYKLTNTGNYPVPWSWAAHPLFAVEEGDRIVLRYSITGLKREGSTGNRLGRNGDQVNWPIATIPQGGDIDLSLAHPPESGIGEKLFAGPLATSENWCALERRRAGLRIRAEFEPRATPYLGLWICYGGWPDRPGPKQVCVAMEPATAPVDSLAQAGFWSRILPPGVSYSWPMVVDFELL